MMLFGTTLIVVTLHSIMPIVSGRLKSETQVMIFHIPNTEHKEESSDDVFLDGPALNPFRSLDFHAAVDKFSRKTVAESTDMHSVADSISTRTERDGKNIVHKEPEIDEKLNKVGCDDKCIINSLDNTSSDGLKDTSSGDPVVVTHLGRVRGRTLDKAHVFYGIPYADPPVGDKRWAPPSHVSPWTYTYDATFPRPACMQVCAGEFSRMCPPKV